MLFFENCGISRGNLDPTALQVRPAAQRPEVPPAGAQAIVFRAQQHIHPVYSVRLSLHVAATPLPWRSRSEIQGFLRKQDRECPYHVDISGIYGFFLGKDQLRGVVHAVEKTAYAV